MSTRRSSFACDDVVDGVSINPKLPDNFDHLANESRPERQMAWWGVPFIRTEPSWYEPGSDLDRGFREEWPTGVRFDLRCLDGGAWDRSTAWGSFRTLAEAVAQAKLGHAVYDNDGRIAALLMRETLPGLTQHRKRRTA